MSTISTNGEVSISDLRNALQLAAIEAHVGYEHEKQWDECDYAICGERKRLIHEPRKPNAQSFAANEARGLHPLGLELLVNCADCGKILNAELRTSHSDYPFSKGILITVERCKCENVPQF